MPPSSSSSSSSPSSSSKNHLSPRPLNHLPTHFTPIRECEREENEDEERSSYKASPIGCVDKREIEDSTHHPTPLHHQADNARKSTGKKRPESDGTAGSHRGVSCNICRPSTREKISVVPLDNNQQSSSNRTSIMSPNGVFKSIFSSLIRKSPKSSDNTPTREEHWKIAVAELSHKLIHATRKRDEAVLEASRLKHSMAELEKKLNKLEVYCHNLKSGLDECSNNSRTEMSIESDNQNVKFELMSIGDGDRVIEHFLVSVSEARSSIRLLSRSLALQIRQMGTKVYERISLLLKPYDIVVSLSKNPRSLLIYLEALLNKAFFEEFESIGFQKNAANQILNPIDRCEANFVSYGQLKSLTWDEVLNRGTRHFSEEFSGFCDRKMSEIVAMLGWNRAWPEPLLQAFFGASKSVWLVHLLANSVHPSLPIFRVDKNGRFDSVYMEDMGGDRARKLVPSVVRIMVAPGFYVYGNVVKCKVICRYQNSGINNDNNKGLTPSPI